METASLGFAIQLDLEKKYQDLVAQSAERVLVTRQALHDVRSTLTLLKLCADSASRAPDLPKCQTLVGQVLKSADALAELVSELTTYFRGDLRSLPLEPRRIRLSEELDALLAPYRLQAESKGILFHYRKITELPAQVMLAPVGLRRVIENVVGNALKFTQRGRIEITATYGGSLLEILVADEGLGIAPEQRDVLFHPYQRVHRTLSEPGGLGLGLFTGRQLAIAMGGDLRLVQSEPGRGSLFRITLRAETVTE